MPDPRPDLMALIAEAARRFNPGTPGVDFQSLLHRLVMAESGGDPNSISRTGAIGYGQLMPGTARDLGVNPYNPRENVLGSARYLSQGLKQYGNVNDALSRYNSGLPYARGSQIPGVSDYVSRVSTGRGLGTLPQQSSIKRKKKQTKAAPGPAVEAAAPPTPYTDPTAGYRSQIIAQLMGSPQTPYQNPYTTVQPVLNEALGVTDANQTPLGIESALARLASGGPNRYDEQQAQAQAGQAGNQATLDYYGQHPYPQATPSHFQYPAPPVRNELPLPNRQAPGGTLMETILGAIGGLIAPQGAGYFASAPLQAASDYADQQYRDNLTRYQLGTEQAANRYGDQRFGYEQSVDEQIRNAQSQQLAEQINQGRDISRTDTLAEPTAALAGQKSLLSTLPGLSQRAGAAELAGNQLGVVGNYIAQQDAANRYGQTADDKRLRILDSLLRAQELGAYHGSQQAEDQQKIALQKKRDEARAKFQKDSLAFRKEAANRAATDPGLALSRQLSNQLKMQQLQNPVLSPTQKYEYGTAVNGLNQAEQVRDTATSKRKYIEILIAQGRISDEYGVDVDPNAVLQQAQREEQQAQMGVDLAQGQLRSLIESLPKRPGEKPAPPPTINWLADALSPLERTQYGVPNPKPAPAPAKTGQANLPATPKAGKKTPPKPPKGKTVLHYNAEQDVFHP